MNTLITVVVIASCALASNQPRDGWNVLLANAIAERNETEVIRLTEARARDKWEGNSLHFAAAKGDVEVVKILIDHGANVNAKNKWEETSLHSAAGYGRVEVVKILIDRGVDVNAKNKLEETPLHFAAGYGYVEVVKILIDHGADVNSKIKTEATPLHYATSAGHVEVVKFLIDHSANVNAKDEWRATPLHKAAFYGHVEVVKILIDHSADVNAKDIWAETPLHFAAGYGHYKTVETLVNSGTDIDIKNKEGKTARDISTEKGYTKIADWLYWHTKSAAVQKVNEVCARYSIVQPTDTIAEGTPVIPEELPWMAALIYNNINTICGGTLISERFVLTAAHCASPSNAPIAVLLGKLYLTDQLHIKYYIQDIIRHEAYSSTLKRNDIALLKLRKDIESFTPAIRPACLETNLEDQDINAKLIVSGWGATRVDRDAPSNILMKAEVQTIPLSQCNEMYMEYNRMPNFTVLRNGINKSQYCAGNPKIGDNTCRGDSGGPLQIFHNSYTAHVVGIISFGLDCTTVYPSIHTRVAYYTDWIYSHVWKV